MALLFFANLLLAVVTLGLTEGQTQQQQQQQQQFPNGPPFNGPPFNGFSNGSGNGPPPRNEDPQKAIARLINSNTVRGVIVLTQTTPGFGSVRITGNVTGLAPNSIHGFHIHEFGDVTNGCAGAGAHFNPRKTSHGAPSDSVRHEGDLGNIFADQNGIVSLDGTFDFVRLGGPGSAIGRSVVVHEKADDLGQGGATDSLTTGNAGARLACGVFVVAA